MNIVHREWTSCTRTLYNKYDWGAHCTAGWHTGKNRKILLYKGIILCEKWHHSITERMGQQYYVHYCNSVAYLVTIHSTARVALVSYALCWWKWKLSITLHSTARVVYSSCIHRLCNSISRNYTFQLCPLSGIPGMCPCGPKSWDMLKHPWALSRDTMVTV